MPTPTTASAELRSIAKSSHLPFRIELGPIPPEYPQLNPASTKSSLCPPPLQLFGWSLCRLTVRVGPASAVALSLQSPNLPLSHFPPLTFALSSAVFRLALQALCRATLAAQSPGA